VLRDDVAGPLGVEGELFFGMPEAELGRLARLEDVEGSVEWLESLPSDHPMFSVGPLAVWPTAGFGNRPDVLMADIPAGCKNTARAVARMYAALLGEVDGVRLISPQRLREVTAVAVDDVDQVMGNPAVWGLGYAIGRPGSDGHEAPTAFGFAGAGGSWAWADTATGVAVALAKNRLTGDFSAAERIAGLVTEAVAGH
jgi:CubicO group peptidase (beta-lactamase class C family)